jgi:hypothetical protein
VAEFISIQNFATETRKYHPAFRSQLTEDLGLVGAGSLKCSNLSPGLARQHCDSHGRRS